MSGQFQRWDVDGLRFHVLPDRRFQRITAVLVWQEPLAEDVASSFALVPRLLRRGSRRHPNLPALERELAQLYGASLTAGVEKLGDRHVASLRLTWPARPTGAGDPSGAELARRALSLLFEVATSPPLEDSRFPADRVEEEKQAQIQRIRALVNDKASYAVRRCVQHMCADEPYGVSELGEPERLAALTGDQLAQVHRQLLERSPYDLFMVGDVDPGALATVVEKAWRSAVPAGRRPRRLPDTVIRSARSEPLRVQETLPMEQGWLVLGLRAPIGFDHPRRAALEMYNGILGGFVHSKLFLQVRERASLAYSAFSRLVRSKGLVLAMAGIDPGRRSEAEAIMMRQIEDMAAGHISDEELEATRRSLIDRLHSDFDRPGALIRAALERSLLGREEESHDALIAAFAETGREEVRQVAQEVGLDTIYFLHGGS